MLSIKKYATFPHRLNSVTSKDLIKLEFYIKIGKWNSDLKKAILTDG